MYIHIYNIVSSGHSKYSSRGFSYPSPHVYTVIKISARLNKSRDKRREMYLLKIGVIT